MTEVVLETYLIPPSEDDLFETLREAGYEPQRGEIHEKRGTGPQVFEIVLRVVEDIGSESALILLGVGVNWARKRLKLRAAARAARVRVLYGPDGDVAREVRIDDADEP